MGYPMLGSRIPITPIIMNQFKGLPQFVFRLSFDVVFFVLSILPKKFMIFSALDFHVRSFKT
jgi:hypothetical protein